MLTATAPTEGKKEIFAAWGIFISLALLIAAFFASYLLQMKKVTAIHETVISIFAGQHTLLYTSAPLHQPTGKLTVYMQAWLSASSSASPRATTSEAS